MSHLTHDLDIYPARLHLLTKPKQWAEHNKQIPMPTPEPPGSVGMTLSMWDRHEGLLHVAIWVDVKWHRKYDHPVIDTLVHEAVHAAGAILDHIEASYGATSEPLAYLVEWIARWLRENVDG